MTPHALLLRPAALAVVLFALPDHGMAEPTRDFDRFHGVYGSPDQPGRDFIVQAPGAPPGSDRPAPPGDLAVSAMWGDVAPWHLEAVDETRFVEVRPAPYQPEPVRVIFRLDDDGRVTGLRFETLFDERGELERLDDSPSDR